MKKKTIILIISAVMIAALAGLVFGTDIIVKSSNKEFGKDPEFYKALGNHFAEKGQFAEAIVAYESCLLLGDDRVVRNNLAVLYYQQGKYLEAIAQLRSLLIQEPNNVGLHYDLAVNLVDRFRNSKEQSLADLEEAFAEYEKANELQPGYSHTQENIEVLKTVMGR